MTDDQGVTSKPVGTCGNTGADRLAAMAAVVVMVLTAGAGSLWAQGVEAPRPPEAEPTPSPAGQDRPEPAPAPAPAPAPSPAQVPAPVPAPAPTAAVAAWERAIEQVRASGRSDDAFLRANAIEAAQMLPDHVVPMVQLGLEDRGSAVRFAALATIGKLRLTDLAPSARARLRDESPSVRAAAMFALRACGQEVDISPMAGMLVSREPTERGNAALLLGWLGEKSAAAMMRELSKAPMPRANPVQDAIVRLQVAEALVRLGDEEALDAVRAGAYSAFDEVRVLAVTMMGELGDRRMEKGVLRLMEKPPIELQLASAGTLARMGHADGLKIALHGSGSYLETVRSQSAWVLGWLDEPEAGRMLERLLRLDKSEMVRLSAASAVLRAHRRAEGRAAAMENAGDGG